MSQRCDFMVQLEKGDEKETPHLQGVVFFENARSFEQVKQLFPRWHHEKCANKKAAIEYCSKQHGFQGRRWNRGFALPPKDPLKGIDLRPWQEEMKRMLKEEPDNRTVHWFWCKLGASGKTAMQKSLAINENALIVSGKGADIKYAIANRVNKEKKSLPIVCFNFPRSMEEFISYESIEQIKDGLFFSGKYESEQCIFDPPHVFCFANYPPKMEKLSSDRWDVKEINTLDYSFF